mmetsp:Transcript_49920/g.161548  ORF Transcript_49920/g.161548 Transcript_49920/m.161548 type:complete len:204 (-) Transcript_49920:943-1554(-)
MRLPWGIPAELSATGSGRRANSRAKPSGCLGYYIWSPPSDRKTISSAAHENPKAPRRRCRRFRRRGRRAACSAKLHRDVAAFTVAVGVQQVVLLLRHFSASVVPVAPSPPSRPARARTAVYLGLGTLRSSLSCCSLPSFFCLPYSVSSVSSRRVSSSSSCLLCALYALCAGAASYSYSFPVSCSIALTLLTSTIAGVSVSRAP